MKSEKMRPKVAVLGAGVIGLSSALRLTQEIPNAEVTVVAASFDMETTSSGAAGLWEPYKLSDTPVELIRQWGGETFQYLQRLLMSGQAASSGVMETTAYQLWTKEMEDPDWKDLVPHFHRMTPAELHPHNVAAGGKLQHGWSFTTLICEGATHLVWLQNQFREAGGKLLQRKVNSLQELAGYDLVVNCTGLGAAELFGDTSMFPIKGHVIRMHAPWIKSIYFTDETTYVIPNKDTVVLGGTGYIGNWDLEPNAEDRRGILERCTNMVPSLAEAKQVREWVGLRPGRKSVRLEKETIALKHGSLKVVHNYGHGGAGLTLAWGCAGHAVKLASEFLGEGSARSKL